MRVPEKCLPIINIVILAIVIFHTHSVLWLRCRYNTKTEVIKLTNSLRRVFLQLKALGRNHSRLIVKLKMFPELINATTLQLYALSGVHLEEWSPTEEYEDLRRKIYSGTKELWYYVNYQLMRAVNESLNLELKQIILKEVAERKRWLLSDQERQPSLDGHEEWRRREAASVSDLIQRRLHYLQNPLDCRTAKKLVCRHDSNGFGCNLHHVVYCLIIAYALERTLVLTHTDDRRNPFNNWTSVFKPISETCTEFYIQNVTTIVSANIPTANTVYLPASRRFDGLPVKTYFIPKDLAQRIVRFNGHPYSWWIGQVVKYILKLRRPYIINYTIAKMNFKSPVVGIHIRHTDKFMEAKNQHLDEYMSHVDDYYAQLELTRVVEQRRVYLATDDVDVLKEAIARYPQYRFYGDYYKAKTAATNTRFTSQGLNGFLVDLHMLARCDYVVCTFSSNIGRMAYELMQTTRTDATNRFTSLDHMYYFSVLDKHRRVAVKRNKHIAFNIGDLIEYRCLHGGITIKGTVLRTKVRGYFPLYKTEEHIMLHPYPEYKTVSLFTDTSQNNTLRYQKKRDMI